MSTRHGTDPGRGLGLIDTRLPFADLDASLSVYTEANPRPGTAVSEDARSKLSPSVTGDQQQGVEVYVVKSGLPGVAPSGHGAIAYKRASEASTEWRGWARPNFLNGWAVLEWSDTFSYPHYDCVTIPDSQKIVAVYTISDGGGARTVSRTLDPSTWTWSAASVVRANTAVTNYDCAVCVLGDGRLVAISNRPSGTTASMAYYSDDAGATWSEYAEAPIAYGVMSEIAVNPRATMVCAENGQIAYLRVANTGIADRAWQQASNDSGGTFTAVGTSPWVTNPPLKPTLLALKSGRIALVYEASGGGNAGQACIRVVGSAYESLESATETSIDATTGLYGVAAWVDADGAIYVIIGINGTAEAKVSYDEGATWAHVNASGGSPWYLSTGADYPIGFKAAPSMGRVALLHQWVASTGNEDGSLASMLLGGWSNVEGFELDPVSGDGASWLPIELPGDSGLWTPVGAGTETLVSPGEMSVVTVANTREFTRSLTAYEDVDVIVELRVTAGGSLASAQCGCELFLGNGVTRYRVRINATTTGFRVQENAAVTLGDVAIDMTTGLQIRMFVDGASFTVKTWYRRPASDQWVTGPTGSLTSAASATGSSFRFGHSSAANTTSYWKLVQMLNATAGAFAPASTLAAFAGRPLSAFPYPAPDIGTDGTTAGFLSAAGGPGRLGETYTIAAAYDHGLERAFTEISPSPSEQWQSTDEVLAYLTWDLDYATSLGNTSLFLAVINSNVQTVQLQGSNNGAAWFTQVEYSALVSNSVQFARTGDILDPAAGSDLTRYLWFGELVGGWVHFTATGQKRRIRRQTEGVWDGSGATIRQARIWLEGVDGTEPASGDVQICVHSGVALDHDLLTPYRYWRIRIPAQTTVDGAFRVGQILAGSVHPAGKQWSRGWSVERQPNVETTRDRYGTTRTRENGPPLRRISIAWPDGVMLQIPRGRAAPYIAGNAGTPIATKDDVPHWLEGVLADTKSGEVPVVVFASIPDVGQTITDPTLWMYGRLSSSISIENVLGAEGSGEFHRVSSLVIEEIG